MAPTTLRTLGSVKPVELLRALRSIKAFRMNDKTIPMLCSIRVESDGSEITLAATDRYVLGSYRVRLDGQVAGEPFAWNLSARSTDMLTATLAQRPGSCVLTERDKSLAVWEYGDTIGMFPIDDETDYPAWRALIPSDQTLADGEVGEIGFNPDNLAKFAKVDTGHRNDPMRMRFNGRGSVRVDIGEVFTGLIMPMRQVD
jgi:DNA polymerase-3 subunit beta